MLFRSWAMWISFVPGAKKSGRQNVVSVAQAGAHRQHQVGLLEECLRLGQRAPADGAEVKGIRVRCHVVPAGGGHDRGIEALRQRDDLVAGLGPEHPAARQQHRAARLLQQTHGCRHGLRLGGGRGHLAANQPAHVRQLHALVQHVPREVQMHGPGDAGHGALVRFPGQGRRQLGLAHLHRPFDDRPEHGLLVDLLA